MHRLCVSLYLLAPISANTCDGWNCTSRGRSSIERVRESIFKALVWIVSRLKQRKGGNEMPAGIWLYGYVALWLMIVINSLALIFLLRQVASLYHFWVVD